MSAINTVLVTKEGLEKLKKEFNELMLKKQLAVERVAKAREMGDLSENAEYSSARDELAFIEGRTAELEEMLRGIKTIDTGGKKNKVGVGCKVTVSIKGKKEVFKVVGEWEANPIEKKISHVSPLGKALIGKKIGDKAEVEAPIGKITYTITGIE